MKKLIVFSTLGLLLFKSALAQNNTLKVTPVSSMLIFPLQEKHTHRSSIVSLPNGDFLCAWFMGSSESTAYDVKILGARLQKGSNSWSPPFLLSDTNNIPDCNPVLFVNNKGRLFLL